MAILDDNQFVEVEGRSYINPQVALDESNRFIDNLRSTQQANNEQIQTQTYNLGTEVPSNLGGLVGGESYFSSRYQTPQNISAIQNLRATAQAAALNDVLANEQAIWKKRYQDAYRNYQQRQSARANSYYGGGSGSGGGSNSDTWNGEVELKTTDEVTDDNTDIKNFAEGIINMYNSVNNGTPPNPYSDEYYIDGAEQTKRIQERTGLPDWLVNSLKITG